MPRRKADLVEELFNLMLAGPVWLGPALAAFAFGFCRFYLPWAFSGSGSSNPGVTAVQQGMKAFIQPLARTGSWWVLGFFLLLWLCTLGARANRRRVY